MQKPVLIVDDDYMHQQMLAKLLQRKLGFEAALAGNGREALDYLDVDGVQVQLVILDLHMPVMDGMETLEILAQRYPSITVIMLTGNQDVENAVQALKLGATDFLAKPYEIERMVTTIRNAIKLSTLRKEVTRLKNETEGHFSFSDLIGYEHGLLKSVTLGRKAAGANIPVLITGETGTGKEVFAKAIHGESARSGNAFIAVNCGAIPSQLVESTLFGHEKGAFTGATEKVAGKFREAEGGTIFLDEVGELPLETQVKLLRVLQQKEVEPVGAGKPVPVNVRILSATNRDLKEEIAEGRFREDLFFRLNVLELELPALRARKEDVLKLANHFIQRFCAHHGIVGKVLSDDAQGYLCKYDWPGNVRQLENLINRAVVLSDSVELTSEDFAHVRGVGDDEDSHSLEEDAAESVRNPTSIVSSDQSMALKNNDGSFKTMEELEIEIMKKVLQACDGNITQASQSLNIAKSTFYRKMKSES